MNRYAHRGLATQGIPFVQIAEFCDCGRKFASGNRLQTVCRHGVERERHDTLVKDLLKFVARQNKDFLKFVASQNVFRTKV